MTVVTVRVELAEDYVFTEPGDTEGDAFDEVVSALEDLRDAGFAVSWETTKEA